MTEGFTIVLHRCLTEPILFAGVPRRFAICNSTITAALFLGYHSWFMLPVGGVLHLIAMWMTKRDAWFFEIVMFHIKDKTVYVG